MAIEGKNIVYAGNSVGAMAFIGEKTNTTDLKGKVILPGIISGHEHPMAFMAVSAGLFITMDGVLANTHCIKRNRRVLDEKLNLYRDLYLQTLRT